ncbi:MAG: nucleotidyltransferase [Polyangiaceae bacterium]|nr:nucleotidyltransferase [Polyangiaceae bacterium]
MKKIHLRRFSEEATLRQKRDAILTRLCENSPRTFTWFNQGSYEMGTGVKPINGDYDIDVGVIFDLGNPIEQPQTEKRWVRDAVKNHTKSVLWKEPCITVQYQSANEPVYHVDLAVYGKDTSGQLYLARGREFSADPRWELCDPRRLTATIGNRFIGEDAAQFRRVVQYLKRWKDEHFPAEGNAAPVGTGLTILAHNAFNPVRTGYPVTYDDLTAMSDLVRIIASSFRGKWSPAGTMYRITAMVPVEPRDDVFARMTDQQSTEFKARVDKLKGYLDEAARTRSSTPLRWAFGTDFPE